MNQLQVQALSVIRMQRLKEGYSSGSNYFFDFKATSRQQRVVFYCALRRAQHAHRNLPVLRLR